MKDSGITLGQILDLIDNTRESEEMYLVERLEGDSMEECANCGFYDEEYVCKCPHFDKWYACPIENKKPENIKALKEYADWMSYKVRDKE